MKYEIPISYLLKNFEYEVKVWKNISYSYYFFFSYFFISYFRASLAVEGSPKGYEGIRRDTKEHEGIRRDYEGIRRVNVKGKFTIPKWRKMKGLTKGFDEVPGYPSGLTLRMTLRGPFMVPSCPFMMTLRTPSYSFILTLHNFTLHIPSQGPFVTLHKDPS
jgi:hypothetical protein